MKSKGKRSRRKVKVFTSYSSFDLVETAKIIDAISQAGYYVNHAINDDACKFNINDDLHGAMKECKMHYIFISRHSIGSKWLKTIVEITCDITMLNPDTSVYLVNLDDSALPPWLSDMGFPETNVASVHAMAM